MLHLRDSRAIAKSAQKPSHAMADRNRVPSGAEAQPFLRLYGMAEAVPFQNLLIRRSNGRGRSASLLETHGRSG
jgi:hypothetical protein